MSEKLLILGRAGCGKTTLLLEVFCSNIKAQSSTRKFGRQSLESKSSLSSEPLDSKFSFDNVLFLLPTHSQVEHIKDVIIRKGFAPGFFEKGICTFSQLARETLGYQGFKGPITEVENGAVLREVLRKSASGRLKYFEGKEEFHGLQVALLRFFKELKEDGQYPTQFREAVEKVLKQQFVDATTTEKYLNLAEAYFLYQTALEKRVLLDEDDLLNQLLYTLETDETLLSQKRLLLVDGFHDFTPIEFRILKILINKIPRVLVSLVLDTETRDSTVFERCRDIYKELKSLGLKSKQLKEFCRSNSPTLRQVEKGLFNLTFKPIEADNTLEIIEAVDVEDEVDQIARCIYQMVSRGEVKYHDIAIIFRGIDPYRDIIETVFHKYNIPVRIHIRKPLPENPLVKGLLSLLRVLTESWKDEEVLRALKSPYAGLLHSEVDYLEYSILENGRLDSCNAWLELMENRSLVNLYQTKKFIKCLAEMARELDVPHPSISMSTLSGLTSSFFRSWFMWLINRFISLPEMDNPSYSYLLKEESQGLRAFLELLDRQCQITSTPLTFKAFLEELLMSISCASYALQDKRHEVVNVIDALEARQWEKPVVFVCGLLEKQFPRQGREDIFLKDVERRNFTELTGINLQEVLKRTHEEERFLFYVALTRAKHKLILSYSAMDSQGRPTLPSFYLEEVKKLFTPESYNRAFRKRSPGNFIPRSEEILTQKDLRNFIFHHLTSPFFVRDAKSVSGGLHDLARRVYNRELCEKNPWLEDLKIALERPEGDKGNLELVNCLKVIISSFSATQFSDYAQCPFLHFCRWILKLKPLPKRAEEGLSPTLQGEIIHDTLRHYYSEGATNLEEHFQESFAKKTRGIPRSFKEEKLKKEMLQTLKAFAEKDKEYISKIQFKPHYMELSFGRENGNRFIVNENATISSSIPPLELKNKDGTILRLSGRIDRIDIAEIDGETMGLVIDYKYSRKVLNENKLKRDYAEGTDLQLPIYLMVIRDLLGLKPIGAQLYSLNPLKSPERVGIITLPLPNKGEHITQEVMESLLEACKEHLFKQVEGILAGDKRIDPRDTEPCLGWCEYRDICRIERRRRGKNEE